jgi:hypothetical protein
MSVLHTYPALDGHTAIELTKPQSLAAILYTAACHGHAALQIRVKLGCARAPATIFAVDEMPGINHYTPGCIYVRVGTDAVRAAGDLFGMLACRIPTPAEIEVAALRKAKREANRAARDAKDLALARIAFDASIDARAIAREALGIAK